MASNTIVTAGDANYAWGVWLLIMSARQQGMTEPIIVGAYRWPESWLRTLQRIPGVTAAELGDTDQRCLTCRKPEVMLLAETEYSTWVDADGIFTGNCSAALTGETDRIYVRRKTPEEVAGLYLKERGPGDSPDAVPPAVLDVWRRDVNGGREPDIRRGVSAAVISLHRSRFDFLKTWQTQMQQVLPDGVEIVDSRSSAYFQTDEAVLNSLLLFAAAAPEVTADYRLDRLDAPHYVHFAFNPKPWIMWNPSALRHYASLLAVVAWGLENGYAPEAPLPYTLVSGNERLCRTFAPLAPLVYALRKRWRRWFR